MTRKSKARKFTFLLILMMTYVLGVNWLSEPTYVQGDMPRPKPFDLVVLPEYESITRTSNVEVEQGMVLQVSADRALVKIKSPYLGGSDSFKDVKISEGAYRVIGEGTIYHKVNHFIGFNLMFTSQLVMIGLIVLLFITQIKLLSDLI